MLTSADTIFEKQEELLAQRDPETIQEGDFVSFLSTQQVFTGQRPTENLVEEEGITVTEREEFEEFFFITTQREVIDHTLENKPSFKFEDTMGFYKEGFGPEDLATEEEVEQRAQVVYQNLSVEEILYPRPQSVKEREPCPVGLDCRIPASRLTYEQLIPESEGNPSQRILVEVVISLNVPFFATILSNCVSTVVVVEDSRPLVRQCKTVYDYQTLD